MGTFARAASLSVAAALLLALAAAVSSARDLSISSQQFRARWTELELTAAGQTGRCAVTMEGRMTSATITKDASSRVGSITTASSGSCTNGDSMTVAQETLPWTIRYENFEGALPLISGWRQKLERLKVWISNGTMICAVVSSGVNLFKLIWKKIRHGERSTATAEGSIPLSGGFVCEFAGNATVGGEATLTVPGESGEVIVTLI